MANDLNQTPAAERVHIGFFGLRNAGKSSLVNAVTGQDLSIVSEIKGTTTDPVSKTMELLPLGPVVILDTPGLDDEGELGALRVKRAFAALNRTDVAVVVTEASGELSREEQELIRRIREKKIPYVVAYNKSDRIPRKGLDGDSIAVSAVTGENVDALRARIAELGQREESRPIAGDLLGCGDTAVLVTPIDESAPKGRMILPQVQTIRDLMDAHAACVVTQPEELPGVLDSLKTAPAIVITDSQVFGKVKDLVPETIPLTSFSILFARYKGVLETAVKGAAAIDRLRDGDTVLISEGCTHRRQCKDIGTVKLPGWIRQRTGKDLTFRFTSGTEFPEDLSPYALVIHCGGCMLSQREVRFRRQCAEDQGIPFTNYGTAIAYLNGILKRSLAPFPDLEKLVER